MAKLNKFQSVVERLMTEDERNELGTKLGLSTEVMNFIHEQFEQAVEQFDEYGEGVAEDDFARGNGRLGLYMSHQDVWADFATEMGFPKNGHAMTKAESRKVDRVFDKFFAE
jgi:hypothetical protein